MYGEGAFFMMATLFDEIDFKDQKMAVHRDATKVFFSLNRTCPFFLLIFNA